MHVEDIAKINFKIIKDINKFKNKFIVFNLMNKREYTNFQVMNAFSEILAIKPQFVLKQISKKESINQLYKSKDDILKIIKYKPQYTNLKNILYTNRKCF